MRETRGRKGGELEQHYAPVDEIVAGDVAEATELVEDALERPVGRLDCDHGVQL